ncbi:unnamed protein product [Closterium sp. Naga37s-1]|nr:unnamed protein product [Closterium sp. Naga37s-1]
MLSASALNTPPGTSTFEAPRNSSLFSVLPPTSPSPGTPGSAVGHAPGSVHVDVLPAMTGFSRFTQLAAPWSYSKQEGLTLSQLSHSNFSYLLSAHPSVPPYEPVADATGFVRMRISIHENGLFFFLSLSSLPPCPPTSAHPSVPPYEHVANATGFVRMQHEHQDP